MRPLVGAVLFLPACGSAAATTPSSPALDASLAPTDASIVDAGVGDTAAGTVPPRDAAPDAPPVSTLDAGAICGAFARVTKLDPNVNGPFATTRDQSGPNCTIVHPTELGQGGVKHPVIIWGNGTDAPTDLYAPAFDYWASYGFIVAAANTVNGQGSGDPELACLGWVQNENARAGSAFEGKICTGVAATGHSQGGAGAIMAGRDARVTVTAPLMPYTRQDWGGFDQASIPSQHATPMLLLSGTLDDNATPSVYQQPVFDHTNVPVFWANLVGADHYSTALGVTNYRATMLAWFRLHLMQDEDFRAMFYDPGCSLCADNAWIVQRKGL